MIERQMREEVKRTKSNQSERETDGDPTDEDGVHVVLWTRRPVCGPRTEIIDRLSGLASSGALAEFVVETWPDEVALSEHTQHTRVVETYRRLRAWAQDNGVSISPPFERRTVTSLVGRTEEVLTLPVMCLTVYDEDLCGVYPCSSGERTWTVTDYLDAFETVNGRPGAADVDGLPSEG